MRNEFDFAPFYRSSIGFDRVFNLLNNPQRLQAIDAWPPYDIVKSGDSDYRIQMAVAGFADGDLHRGIAGRSFERRFELADHVRVENASLANGLLTIELKREIPEAMKPRKIAIGSAEGSQAPMQMIEGEKNVA